MTMYKVFRVTNGEKLFSTISNRKKEIDHPRFKNLLIYKTLDYIKVNAKESVVSIFSPNDNPFYDQINIDIVISQYQFGYCIVGLSGRGLMTNHSYEKYMKDDILSFLKQHFFNAHGVDLDFSSFEYDNENFSKKFWDDSIKTGKAYFSSESMHMHINISSKNFYKLIEEKLPEFEKYFTNGKIKFIRGVSPDLFYEKDGKQEIGSFRFERNGMFHCNFNDTEFFNNFVMKLIDKKFFIEANHE